MKVRKDLMDRVFGLLRVTALSTHVDKAGHSHWECTCICGRVVIARADNLLAGKTTQCSRCRKHGGKRSRYIKEVT